MVTPSPSRRRRAGFRPLWTTGAADDLWLELTKVKDQRYEQRFKAQEQAVAAAFAAQEKAVSAVLSVAQRAVAKADEAGDDRPEDTNEWWAAMSDGQHDMMPRVEAEQRIAALTERVSELSERLTATAGRSRGIGGVWLYLVAGLVVSTAVISTIVFLWSRQPS